MHDHLPSGTGGQAFALNGTLPPFVKCESNDSSAQIVSMQDQLSIT